MKVKRVVIFCILIGVIGISCGIGLYEVLSTVWDRDSKRAQNISYQPFEKEDVVYSKEHLPYVSSQILLTVKEGTKYDDVAAKLNDYGGAIVGFLDLTNDYQIEFNEKKNYKELNDIIDELKQWEPIESVGLHEVFETSNQEAFHDDPWDNAQWSVGEPSKVNPVDQNWWAEAIGMPFVWHTTTQNIVSCDEVKVGVLENEGNFNTRHEDMEGRFIKVSNSIDGNGNHAMEVSGLIAATLGNGRGGAGVAQNARLYGGSLQSEANSLFQMKYNIAYFLGHGVKVINNSFGTPNITASAFYGGEKNNAAREELKEYNDDLRDFLQKYIDANYEFLICNAAGNDSNVKFEKVSNTQKSSTAYQVKKDADGNPQYYWLSRNVNAKYALFSGIEDTDSTSVAEHIIVVGATEAEVSGNETKYSVTNFSNTGDRVDLYAPGRDIYTCTFDGYESHAHGTSFSTPIVAGTAAVVWGINPNLTAAEVKQILVDSATTKLENSDKHMLNAWNAEIAAVQSKSNKKELNAVKNQICVMGTVKDEDGNPSENAKVRLLTNISGEKKHILAEGETNSDGEFTLMVDCSDNKFIKPLSSEETPCIVRVSKKGKQTKTKKVIFSSDNPVAFFNNIVIHDNWKNKLTQGYWWNSLQELGAYRFSKDGVWYSVQYEGNETGISRIIKGTEYRIGRYEVDDDYLTLYWDDTNFSAKLLYGKRSKMRDKLETQDAINEWDALPYPRTYSEDVGIFYETNYVEPEENWSFNAMWLIPYDGDVSKESADVADYTGTCGDNLTWALDSSGTLTISGSGEMEEYFADNEPPWESYKDRIWTVVIEDGVTTAGSWAFDGYSNLSSLVLGNSVAYINREAFADCTSLSSIKWGTGLLSIGQNSFSGCTSLTSLEFPDGMTSINRFAFSNCTGLTEITFPESFNSIETSAFSGCTNIETITFEGQPATNIYINSSGSPQRVFDDISATVYYHLGENDSYPKGVMQTQYGKNLQWEQY